MFRSLYLLPAAALVLSLTGPALGFTGQKYVRYAQVTLADARVIALKARPGKITDSELEYEKGGSGLRYSFDIQKASNKYEVGVDAKTGAVLENSTEGANPD